uniref:Aminoglycoside phosphotransferase domain-containing protein n=1 Tax=Bionectria ochroleuca TaxID=29856 RepID=A0A8H7NPD7_BIOOC
MDRPCPQDQCHVPPAALRDHIVQSEVATLKFLDKTGVRVPKVYDFSLERPDNPVGVGYILMEKLPGKSLRWGLANQDQKNKVMSQIADTFAQLHRYPFDLLGSLGNNPQGFPQVGPFARESLTRFEDGKMDAIGPFSSLEDYHMSSIRLILDLILQEEMYPQQAVDAYLIHRFLIDLVPRVLPQTDDEKFYLKHADDKETISW